MKIYNHFINMSEWSFIYLSSPPFTAFTFIFVLPWCCCVVICVACKPYCFNNCSVLVFEYNTLAYCEYNTRLVLKCQGICWNKSSYKWKLYTEAIATLQAIPLKAEILLTQLENWISNILKSFEIYRKTALAY